MENPGGLPELCSDVKEELGGTFWFDGHILYLDYGCGHIGGDHQIY